MSGHGASKDCQFFLLNAKDDVCFPVESKMRATSEAYDVNVFAIYDICRSNLEDYQYNKGIEQIDKVGTEMPYMHLGAMPRQTVDANSKMAEFFINHIEQKARENGGLIHIPIAMADIGNGIQATFPTIDQPYTLKYSKY